MVRSAADTVDEYLAELPPERAAVVEEVRELVIANIPDGVVESMNFGMIAYEIPLSRYPETYNGQPLMYAALAAQKHYYALYLHSAYADEQTVDELHEAYAQAGIRFDMGKSCLRFNKLDDFLPAAAAKAIAACTVEDYIELYEASRPR